MRTRRLLIAVAVLAGTLSTAAQAQPPACAPGLHELSGVVHDEATNAPLDEVTSVGINDRNGVGIDDDGAQAGIGTWRFCLTPGTYTLSFNADSYFPEQWEDRAPGATPTRINLRDGDVTGLVARIRHYPVITGRLLSARDGLPVGAAGLGVHANGDWGGESEPVNEDGTFELMIKDLGGYRLAFYADEHFAEWWNDSRRRSQATTIRVRPRSGLIDLGDIELRACGPARSGGGMCIPANFNR